MPKKNIAEQITMARPPKVIEESVEEAVAIEEAVAVEEAVQVVKDIPETPPMVVKELGKLVQVIPTFTGTRFVAGTWYNFVKDKPCMVTEYARDLLRARKMIYL